MAFPGIRRCCAAQMVLGSARLALESDTHPAVLKDRVCSPGGSTIVGVHALKTARSAPPSWVQ